MDTKQFSNSVFLITGGTGSFGSTLLNRLVNDYDASEIRIFSRDEKKQDDLRNSINTSNVSFYLGDVRSFDSLYDAVKGVDYIFHAAALKQVPSCEFFPSQAVQTNILGTENLLRAVSAVGVAKSMVLLSTDKAVYPINAMGLSKAMAEKILIAHSRHHQSDRTIFNSTRYGNVMASRGSVIPLFTSQILNGQPLTITDPKMTRFLMSLDDSVDLVLHAMANGGQGDLFVQKSPAATVEHIANALKIIFDKNVPLKVIGTRHGEKLYETLVSREEMAKSVDIGRYYRIPPDTRDLNYSSYFSDGSSSLDPISDYTSHNTTRLGIDSLVDLLSSLPFIRSLIS
ncbi:polysaccharide biosynthesis protein [Synechococcus sp. UW105]|uniref:polysaccharide biosynthesis protein n=1 Tax=Synechococcus sp. UW105 TaxID=337067 RepID=UPI000E0E29CA|nr:polysaccharide biosynthesis protein [Synechococcus sp. UW105]